MTESLEITEPIEAQRVIWRVFGLLDVFENRPRPEWSVNERRGPGNADELRVTIGEPPADLVLALRQWRAQMRMGLSRSFGSSMTSEEKISKYQQHLLGARLPEFDKEYPLWLTIRLSRPIQIMARPGVELDWIPEAAVPGWRLDLIAFSDEGNKYLNGVVARILAASEGLHVHGIQFSDPRAFLIAPGRAATTFVSYKASGIGSSSPVERPDGWEAAPTEAISAAIRSLPGSRTFSKVIADTAQWLCASLDEKDDVLRRFVFSFAGLEMLATQMEKLSRDKLTQRIADADARLPINELLWPSSNEDLAQRNLVFRFAIMAAVFSPATAIEDVKEFRSLARTRNLLYHGSDLDRIDFFVSVKCLRLLQRYLTLIVQHESGNPSTPGKPSFRPHDRSDHPEFLRLPGDEAAW